MLQTGLIPNAHGDLVTDAAYDFYGLRLATCGLDHQIKVWELDESTGKWAVEDEWRAHDAAVAKLSWAHPEHGSILASASFDRTVKIWEQTYPDPDAHAPGGRWIERATLTDARGTVRAAEFAPHHLGLKLATISTDNHLRLYESLEQPSLTTWTLGEEVDVSALASPSTSASPAPSSHALPTPTQAHSHDSGTPPAALVSEALQAQEQQGLGRANREADGGWAISWCKERYWGELLAVACGVSNVVKIVHFSASRRPSVVLALNLSPKPTLAITQAPAPNLLGDNTHRTRPLSQPTGQPRSRTDSDASPIFSITTVSWAPNCGRSYHLVATGGRDGHVRIWKLRPPPLADEMDTGKAAEDEEKWTATLVADFDHHKSAVGRVEWNITGTVLSSAGNDGRVRVWKMAIGGEWKAAGYISVEQAEDEEGHDVEMEEE